MAEICCDLVSSTEATRKAEPQRSSRAAKRRRVVVRRFGFVTQAEAMAPEMEESSRRKRTGMVGSSSSLDSSRARSIESRPSNELPRYGMVSICGRRRDMEDAVSIHTGFVRQGFDFFGVFDGHGCSHVAMSCKETLHEMVAEEIDGLGSTDPPPEEFWTTAMERSFARMDAEARGPFRDPTCRCELKMPKCEHVGSTALVAVVGLTRIVVANCGDSRAVLCRNGVPLSLSSDHKPDRPDELERIEAAGGRVIYWDGARVLGVLAMSRAIGDSYLKPFVISEPEVTVTEREEEDEWLILASDGLWDVVSNEMACDVVRMSMRERKGVVGSDKACADAAMMLTKLALAKQSADNVSVVVIDLSRSSKT
ncbi:probable protein phosphatase 2C 30 [Typha latifolia]|uniref:probable protein phosphatase 2C 30 n=1 Tax=Typha latifolia TaxID=4733 RepID=UPI003C2EA2B6